MTSVRTPIAALTRFAPPCPARVAGRVTFADADRALVLDPTGSIEARGETLPPIGAWVVAEGTWDGRALDSCAFELLGTPSAFPAPDGEFLRLNGPSRLLENLKRRATVLRAVRGWFDERAFLEVETPLAVPSPGLDLHLSALSVEGLGAPRWLITSPEYQMKRLLAGGATRIYQLARCFRRGERGDHHEPEFTMLEWYRAFAGSGEMMRDTEELAAHVARVLHHGSTTVLGRGRPVDLAPPWRRMRVEEAFSRIAGVSLSDVLPDEERFFRILVEKIEPGLGYPKPVFLTHWPTSMASLARIRPDGWADRIEAYVDGLELCNGFGELTDPVEQRQRLERDRAARALQGLADYPIDERFLAALAEGMPPSGGNALGIDRLVMLVLGVKHIEDVLAFPQSRL